MTTFQPACLPYVKEKFSRRRQNKLKLQQDAQAHKLKVHRETKEDALTDSEVTQRSLAFRFHLRWKTEPVLSRHQRVSGLLPTRLLGSSCVPPTAGVPQSVPPPLPEAGAVQRWERTPGPLVTLAKPTMNNWSTGNTGKAQEDHPTNGVQATSPTVAHGYTNYGQRYQPCSWNNSPQTERTQHLVGTHLSWVGGNSQHTAGRARGAQNQAVCLAEMAKVVPSRTALCSPVLLPGKLTGSSDGLPRGHALLGVLFESFCTLPKSY